MFKVLLISFEFEHTAKSVELNIMMITVIWCKSTSKMVC